MAAGNDDEGIAAYALYITLLGGGVAGMGTGALQPLRRHGSIALVIPVLQRRLTAANLIFILILTYQLLFSSLWLGGN